MKKILLIAAALFITLSASAQTWGVIGGLTSSNASLKNFDSKTVALYHIGLTANFPVIDGLRLQPELLYNVKGTTLDQVSSLGISGAELDMRAGYLELGLQAQLGIGTGLGRVYGFAEPFLGYNVTDKIQISDNTIDFQDFYSKLEYGLAVGAGVSLTEHIQVSAKYYWNFGDLANADISTVTEAVKSGIQKAFEGSNNFNGVSLSLALLF